MTIEIKNTLTFIEGYIDKILEFPVKEEKFYKDFSIISEGMIKHLLGNYKITKRHFDNKEMTIRIRIEIGDSEDFEEDEDYNDLDDED